MLSHPVALPEALAGSSVACRYDPPAVPDGVEGIATRQRLADRVLAPEERPVFQRLAGKRRAAEWLAGRIAAKDVVILHLRRAGGLLVDAKDIVIATDRHGRPEPAGAALRDPRTDPRISLAHTDGVATAIATAPPWLPGIDVERLSRQRGAFERRAFSEAERRRIGPPADADHHERVLRLWCAKEAIAKALGRGLMGSGRHLEAVECADPGLGRVTLEVAGALRSAFPDRAGAPLPAHTWRDDDLVFAVAVLG